MSTTIFPELDGNIVIDADSLAVFTFGETAGEYESLFGGHALTPNSFSDPAGAALLRPDGHVGLCVEWPATVNARYLGMPQSNFVNCLGGFESNVAVSVWVRHAAGGPATMKIGVDGQYEISLRTGKVSVFNSGATEAYVDPALTLNDGEWHHILAQVGTNGLTGGDERVRIRVHVDGVRYDTIAGTPAIIPHVPASEFTVGFVGTANRSIAVDQMVVYLSTGSMVDDDSAAALFNGGAPLDFVVADETPTPRPGTRSRGRTRAAFTRGHLARKGMKHGSA